MQEVEMMGKMQNDRVLRRKARAEYCTPHIDVFSCGKDIVVTSNVKESGFQWNGEEWTKDVDDSTIWN